MKREKLGLIALVRNQGLVSSEKSEETGGQLSCCMDFFIYSISKLGFIILSPPIGSPTGRANIVKLYEL